MAEWRNRVIERRVMKVNQVSINKRNPKRHPYQQTERLKALLDKFGMVSGGLLAFYDDENLNPTTGEPTLTLFDGHARQGLDPNQEWEICITDLNRAECDQLVLMFDPIAALAQSDPSRQMDLMQDMRGVDGVLGAFLDELARESGFVRGQKSNGSIEELEDDDSEVSGLLAPFPWFGGKSRVAGRIWQRFGQVQNYVEPFCGSAAVLLACPFDIPIVTLNDADGFIANFWRSVAYAPDEVVKWADWPVNENDLFARHIWLIKQQGRLINSLEIDPEWYDAKIAGWWVWGCCAWIGAGWCSGEGPWTVEDGGVVKMRELAGDSRKLPGLSSSQGINANRVRNGDSVRQLTGDSRQLPHLTNNQGINSNRIAGMGKLSGDSRQLPHMGAGRGVNRKIPEVTGRGVHRRALGTDYEGDNREAITAHLLAYMNLLADKLRRPRVTCGDWTRVTTHSVTTYHGLTAILFDPPYGEGEQEYSAGGNTDSQLAQDVWAWAIENGSNPLLRIAVCGYDDGRSVPPGWSMMRWKAHKGYQMTEKARENPEREMVWFSPHCLKV